MHVVVTSVSYTCSKLSVLLKNIDIISTSRMLININFISQRKQVHPMTRLKQHRTHVQDNWPLGSKMADIWKKKHENLRMLLSVLCRIFYHSITRTFGCITSSYKKKFEIASLTILFTVMLYWLSYDYKNFCNLIGWEQAS